MSPEEKSVIDGIFTRLEQAAALPRDPEAERHIAERVRTQPYAPYVMAQTLHVQQQALADLDRQVTALKAELEALSRRPTAPASFLSGLFGGDRPQPGPPPLPRSPFGEAMPSGGPWSRQAAAAEPAPWNQPRGGGFLAGAVSTALGVAGGMMIANALSNAFGHHDAPSKLADGLGLPDTGKSGRADDERRADSGDAGWQSAAGDGESGFDGGFDDSGFG